MQALLVALLLVVTFRLFLVGRYGLVGGGDGEPALTPDGGDAVANAKAVDVDGASVPIDASRGGGAPGRPRPRRPHVPRHRHWHPQTRWLALRQLVLPLRLHLPRL